MSLVAFDDDEDMEPTYRIVRFSLDGPREVRYEGLTLDQARSHCKQTYTHGSDWFEGFESEG